MRCDHNDIDPCAVGQVDWPAEAQDPLLVDSLDRITPARTVDARISLPEGIRARTYQWRLPLLDRIDFADVNDARLPLQISRDV